MLGHTQHTLCKLNFKSPSVTPIESISLDITKNVYTPTMFFFHKFQNQTLVQESETLFSTFLYDIFKILLKMKHVQNLRNGIFH